MQKNPMRDGCPSTFEPLSASGGYVPMVGSSRLSYDLDASNVQGQNHFALSQSKPKIITKTDIGEGSQSAKFIQKTLSDKMMVYFKKCGYSVKVLNKQIWSFQVKCEYHRDSTTLNLTVDFFHFELLQLRDAVNHVNNRGRVAGVAG